MPSRQRYSQLSKLSHLDHWNDQRRVNAVTYNEEVAELDVQVPSASSDVEHVYHLYVIRVRGRDRVLTEMREHGIGAGVHYPSPLHLQPSLAFLGHHAGDFPIAEAAAEQALSLPMFPELTQEQIMAVVSTLADCLEGSSRAAGS
jgi:dTDP-4-amino-4,6-dideoxygalactose transaminase